ncbi:MAG: ribosome small subunit-dependent GTPase A [Crocinitomicaceae bacterium]|nr:ribosome small subunit-dependent GTPase A [Crocinitomicaceae bacterium]
MLEGVVIKSTGKWYQIMQADGAVVTCRIRGKFRMDELRSTNPVAVGDRVLFNLENDNTGVIHTIEERRNILVRKSINLSKKTQILAANIDRVYLLVTLALPETHLAFIDRFLVAAESFRIPATLLFNKIDIYDDEDLPIVHNVMAIYERIGYPCHKISALNKENIEFLKSEINGKQVMIGGHSGTGKSTLINALDARLQIQTQAISAHHLQGQHTTTFAEMHPLTSGGYIIDTPGIRAFGVIDLEKQFMSHYFPEMRELLNECKFHNCLHLNEPKCAVKEKVASGEIAESRYASYVNLMQEDENENYRKDIYGD